MAGLARVGKIAVQLARNPKVREAAQSPQARKAGAQLVDRGADLAQRAANGKHAKTIERVRSGARKRLTGDSDGPDSPDGPGGVAR